MKELDFIKVMRDYVNTLGLSYVCKLGYLETTDSLVVYPLPGGRTIREFYDGIKDKQLIFEFAIKTKSNLQAYNALNQIGRSLEAVGTLDSSNDSYEMDKSIMVGSEPNLVNINEQGYYTYLLTIQVELTTLQEVI